MGRGLTGKLIRLNGPGASGLAGSCLRDMHPAPERPPIHDAGCGPVGEVLRTCWRSAADLLEKSRSRPEVVRSASTVGQRWSRRPRRSASGGGVVAESGCGRFALRSPVV
jgi:hypothetical protein